MILRKPSWFALLALSQNVIAQIAPEITTVAPGYNLIAKLPCVGCPFMYQDTSAGQYGPWITREDGNALLLNISLPFDSAYLSINNGPLLSSSKSTPIIYAPQVLLDTSESDLSRLIETDQLDAPGGASFGLSYVYSLRRLAKSQALLFQFDVLQLWTKLPGSDFTFRLRSDEQKVLEVVLLPRPVLSPGDPGHAFEIVRAELVPRLKTTRAKNVQTMNFDEHDSHGKIGTPSHLLSTTSDSLLEHITSGVWSLFIFILALIGLFVVLCLFCIFGCGCGADEYEKAQTGKKRGSRRQGSWSGNDVEKAKGKFMSAEELGIRSAGRVVGVGKSD
ncbi:hypothetical protein BKA63DRAFT_109689 [Paraphoma chrysanthemicola]|nr:hypothetical protein BKA63DRAFT_109689 [Paraphoma chrysanthemicola]